MDKHLEHKYAQYLWDGKLEVLHKLRQLKQFKRYPEILSWLTRNQMQGQKLLDFFNEESGDETKGVLQGVRTIYNYIDNEKFNRDALTLKELK